MIMPVVSAIMSDSEFLSVSWPKTMPQRATIGEITKISTGSQAAMRIKATCGGITQPINTPVRQCTRDQPSSSWLFLAKPCLGLRFDCLFDFFVMG